MKKLNQLKILKKGMDFRISAYIWNFGICLGFRNMFGILTYVWDFGIYLGFRHMFGISEYVWDFGISFGFGILANKFNSETKF